MTKGGPGFSTDLIASIIYKQYQGGFYGLATAGNVILFLMVMLIAMAYLQTPDKKRRYICDLKKKIKSGVPQIIVGGSYTYNLCRSSCVYCIYIGNEQTGGIPGCF